MVEDGNSGYALRIYKYNGDMVEDFSETDAPLSPENAQVIGETSVFSVSRAAEDLISVTTDAGRALVHLRTGEGGDAR